MAKKAKRVFTDEEIIEIRDALEELAKQEAEARAKTEPNPNLFSFKKGAAVANGVDVSLPKKDNLNTSSIHRIR